MEPGRPKACIPCAESKRRCDKHLPECQRCIQRDIDCSYPQPPKRRRRAMEGGRGTLQRAGTLLDALSQPLPDNHPEDRTMEAFNSMLDLGVWGVTSADPGLGTEAAGMPLLSDDLSNLYVPGLPTVDPILDLVPPSFTDSTIAVPSKPRPWFLVAESWDLMHTNKETACATPPTNMEPYITRVGQMLRDWARTGYSGFIHEKLYEEGMPTCLQDAFVIFAAYDGCTPATSPIILQTAEERSQTLVQEDKTASTGVQGIRDHLARVQALFVYIFMRLFDGSIRLRASAERQIPTLRQWITTMLLVARQYEGSEYFSQLAEKDRAMDFDTVIGAWRLWILTESVRRSSIIMICLTNTYECMLKGWGDCSGAVMFTARKGLWDADSAAKWRRLSLSEPPLLIPSMQPEPFMSLHNAEEVDEFVKFMWTYIVGPDRIDWWNAHSSCSTDADKPRREPTLV